MSAPPAVVFHHAPAASPTHDCLFVSTALEYWSTEQGAAFAHDVQINDVAYRRLDPEYYAWLRSRMALAKKAAMAGRLDTAAFEELRSRFNAVHDWAVKQLGESYLLEAVRTLRAGGYEPPVAEDERPAVPMPRVRRSAADNISPEAITMVAGPPRSDSAGEQ